MISTILNRGSRPARGWAYHARPGGRPSRASAMRCQVTVGRDPVRCAARFLVLICVVLLAGCGPRTSVQSHDGMPLLDVKRGLCFVGCNVIATLPNGTRCSGYAIAMDYGDTLTADIRCPNTPTATLQVDQIQQGGTSIGTLTPNSSLFRNEPIDIDAIIEKHVPRSET